MDKIQFENANLVTPAKVTIDGTDYEVTPAQLSVVQNYLSAQNLNLLQTNVENAINAVVESGSNENGSWTKFPDGTLICKGKVTRDADSENASVFRTFPISFIDNNYSLILTNNYNYSSSIFWSNGVTESTRFSAYPILASTSDTPQVYSSADYIAIGRWK